MRLALVAVIVAGIALAAAIVIVSADEPVVMVDERSGVLNGVRFGDSEAEVRARHGEPSDDDDGFFPEGADFTGPPSLPSPRSDQRPPREPTPLHYDDAAYVVSPTRGVFAMASLAEGARTRAGVGVGDELRLVRERYDRVVCGEAITGEDLFGGELPMYPWCRALVRDGIRVFFGEDPIHSITITTTPLP